MGKGFSKGGKGQDKGQPSDEFIICLGWRLNEFPISEILQNRIKTAIKLHEELRIPIIVSGGTVPTLERTEAELMREIFVNEGLNKEAIVAEHEAQNTVENFTNILKLLSDDGYDVRTVRFHLVTSDFHMSRAAWIANSVLQAQGCDFLVERHAAPSSVGLGRYEHERKLVRATPRLLGKYGLEPLGGDDHAEEPLGELDAAIKALNYINSFMPGADKKQQDDGANSPAGGPPPGRPSKSSSGGLRRASGDRSPSGYRDERPGRDYRDDRPGRDYRDDRPPPRDYRDDRRGGRNADYHRDERPPPRDYRDERGRDDRRRGGRR